MTTDENILRKLDLVLKEVDIIKRGVYGDEDNDVPGLIDHQRDHLSKILDLQRGQKQYEEDKKRVLWIGAGVIAFLQLAIHSVVEWIKK